MSDQLHNNNNKVDKLFENYYGFIGERHIDNVVMDHDKQKDKISKTEIPDNLNKWFEQYISIIKKKETQKKHKKIAKKNMSRVAIIVLILISFTFVITFNVEAVRVKVFNLFVNDKEKYTSISIEEVNLDDTISIDWDQYYYPTYLPEGFMFEGAEEYLNTKIIQFVNLDGRKISFRQASNGTDFQIDTEDALVSETMINNIKGILVEKNSKIILFWNNYNTSFVIQGEIKSDDIIKIAEEIEKK